MACFIQLRESVPSWISDVDQLCAHVYTKRAEFAAEAEKLSAPSCSSSHRAKSISSSLSSVRSGRGVKPSAHGLKRFLSKESLSKEDSFKKQRTAKNDEGRLDARESIRRAPSVRRARPTQVISYDGHTQKVLEKMVRDIWTAKSSIRSSRISSSMRSAFGGRMKMHIPVTDETAEITSDSKVNIEVDPDATGGRDAVDGLEDQLQARISMMKQRSRRNPPTYSPFPQSRCQQGRRPPKECPLDFIEGQLENAQNLCETAAFKFLREGNCLEELDSIKQAYELILEASTTMAEQEEKKLQEETAAQADAIVALEPPAKDLNGTDPEELSAGLLEVDDKSDTSEISIDISAFRMTRYGQRTMAPFKVYRA